jgi:hypothetical protein
MFNMTDAIWGCGPMAGLFELGSFWRTAFDFARRGSPIYLLSSAITQR